MIDLELSILKRAVGVKNTVLRDKRLFELKIIVQLPLTEESLDLWCAIRFYCIRSNLSFWTDSTFMAQYHCIFPIFPFMVKLATMDIQSSTCHSFSISFYNPLSPNLLATIYIKSIRTPGQILQFLLFPMANFVKIVLQKQIYFSIMKTASTVNFRFNELGYNKIPWMKKQ